LLTAFSISRNCPLPVKIVLGVITIGVSSLFFFLKKNIANISNLTFKTPLVPVVPILALYANMYLMSNLSGGTWIRLTIWWAIGVVIYFGYSIRHSKHTHESGHQMLEVAEPDHSSDIEETAN